MEKILYINGEASGKLGKPVFKDSLGRQLCVGDTVCTLNGHNSINIVCDSYIYGWASSTENGDLSEVSAYKLFNNTQLEELKSKIEKMTHNRIEVKEDKQKEMTISEIEKELGYSIKIVKE